MYEHIESSVLPLCELGLYGVKYAMSKRICNSFEEPAVYTLYFVTINNDNQNASWRKNIYWSERT